MPSLDMDGPFAFTKDQINRMVKQTGPGTYALGEQTKDGKFKVRYVGRADEDVREALLDALRNERRPGGLKALFGGDSGSDSFKVSLAASSDAAFEKQCRKYHDFNSKSQLHNEQHPRPPASKPKKCPVCQG